MRMFAINSVKSKLGKVVRTVRELFVHGNRLPVKLSRELIAETYLSGEGIEIGALHNPLKLPAAARVKYVDRLSIPDLRKQYPELESQELVNVDILADGERLETIADESQDFVIANHFVEHCQNPLGAILNMLRVLKPAGILYLALPDKRCCFDSDRPVTPLAHIMRDLSEGPEWSRAQHFEEWARLVNKAADESEVKKQVSELIRMNYSIHYHVWTPFEMLEFIIALRKMAKFDVELCFEHGGVEVIFVLRKSVSGATN